MVRVVALVIALAGALSAPAFGAEDRTVLWRDLQVGDSPEIVARKLLTVRGVKRAKVTRSGKVDVDYSGEGIEILGTSFKFMPTFEGQQLKKVGLGTGPLCTDTGFERAKAIIDVLRQKYPRLAAGSPVIGRGDYFEAKLKANSDSPSGIAMGMTNGKTVVVFFEQFTKADAPPAGYMPGRLASAAKNFLWQEYDRVAGECNGTGVYRVSFSLTYFTAGDYSEVLDGVVEAKDRTEAEAADDL